MKTRNLFYQALTVTILMAFLISQGSATLAKLTSPEISDDSNMALSTSVIFSDDFSTDKGWTNETSGDFDRDTTNEWLSWHIHRSTDEKYYIPINSYSGDFRLEAKLKATYWANNCDFYFGLVEDMGVSWPIGAFVQFGWFGAGIGTHINPRITFSDGTPAIGWDAGDSSTYIDYNLDSWYRIVFEVASGVWTITVYDETESQVGQLTDAMPSTHTGYHYIMLFNPYDGDWPTGDGLFDDLVVESLGDLPDTTPPAAIDDLIATPGTYPGDILLSWTAPGDDGNTDTASTYVMRYNTTQITEANWSSSTDVTGEPAPGPVGSAESMTVSGLTPGQTYYFAIKTQDEVPNTSDISNSPSAVAKGEDPPAQLPPLIIDLRDHGPDPWTAIALVEQPVVWINNGTQDHTITEGDPIFYVHLPLALHGMSTGKSYHVAAMTPSLDDIPVFDSGSIVPGGRFTYTFATTGTFGYYSAHSPGDVIGSIIIAKPSERVTKAIEAAAGGSVTASNGAQIEIGPKSLYTDTTVTLEVLPGLAITINNGIAVGPVYQMQTLRGHVISSPITITFPYTSDDLPIGADESDLRAAYFDGVSWIGMPRVVDVDRNVVVVSTRHLSLLYLFLPSCHIMMDETYFTEAEKQAYEEGHSYLKKLSAHKDLFESFETSDGQLFDIDHKLAAWLGKMDLCALSRVSKEKLSEKLGVSVGDWEWVADAVIDIGEALLSQEYEANKARDMAERLSHEMEQVELALHVVSWSTGGPLADLGREVVTDYVFGTLTHPIVDLLFDFRLALEIKKNTLDLIHFLDSSHALPVGTAGLEKVTGWLEPSDCGFNVGYGNDNSFYQVSLPGYDGATAQGFINLYHHDGYGIIPEQWNVGAGVEQTLFVVGLQEMSPFKHPLDMFQEHLVYVLLEYNDTSGDNRARVSRLLMENAKVGGICMSGAVQLPNIREGSEVQVTYYFIKAGRLDSKLDTDGAYSPIPDGQRLCYGECNEPPNEPTWISPKLGAVDQSVDVDLSWTGGDPDGDQATYDVYLASDDETPDTLACSNVAVETCQLKETLKPKTKYYWRVAAKDEHGLTAEGPVWHFVTGDPPVTIDQVFTTDHQGELKDSFRPGEAIELWLRATNNTLVTIPVTYTWLTLNPVGIKIEDLSWDNWTVSMSPGADEWNLYRGLSHDAPFGTYRYGASVTYASGASVLSTTFVVQGDPLPVVIDEIYVKDYEGNFRDTFKPGEAIRLGFKATNYSGQTKLVTFSWRTYDPDGDLVSSLSWDDWQMSMAPGEQALYLTRGVNLNAALGTYEYEAIAVSGSDTSVQEIKFDVDGAPIDENLLSALTCKDVQGSKPIDIVDTFTTNDTYVYVWTAWEGVSGPYTIRWEWYQPGGGQFHTHSYDFDASEAYYKVWSSVYVASMGGMFGEWHIDIYLNDEYIDTVNFTLQAGAWSRSRSEALPPGASGAAESWLPVSQPMLTLVQESSLSTLQSPYRGAIWPMADR